MKYIYICFIGWTLTACATSQNQYTETAECMNYRGMMTAPMPPAEIEKLHQACLKSME